MAPAVGLLSSPALSCGVLLRTEVKGSWPRRPGGFSVSALEQEVQSQAKRPLGNLLPSAVSQYLQVVPLAARYWASVHQPIFMTSRCLNVFHAFRRAACIHLPLFYGPDFLSNRKLHLNPPLSPISAQEILKDRSRRFPCRTSAQPHHRNFIAIGAQSPRLDTTRVQNAGQAESGGVVVCPKWRRLSNSAHE